MSALRLLIAPACLALACAAGGQERPDRDADALPPGAVARLGSAGRQDHGGPVLAVAFTPDGRQVLSVGPNGVLHFWDARTGKEVRRVRGPGPNLSHVVVSADARVVALACPDGTVAVWDAVAGKERCRLRGPGGPAAAVALSADGKTAATTSGRDRAVCLWDAATGKELRWLTAPAREMTRLAFAPDGNSLASAGSFRAPVVVWDLEDRGDVRLFGEANTSYGAVAFSPDGEALAASGGADGGVTLWKAETGYLLRRLGGQNKVFGAIAFSPDGRTLWGQAADGIVRLWQTRNWEEVGKLAKEKEPPVRGWEVATGLERCRFGGHAERVLCLAPSPDGRLLATGSADGTVLVWDVAAPAREGRARGKLTAGELDALWLDLASPHGVRAYRAVRALAAAPAQAVPLLRERLRSVSPDRLTRLVADLGAKQFRVRARATAELEFLGRSAAPAINKALAAAPTLEERRRMEQLLEKADRAPLSPHQARMLRGIEALEAMGTPEARALLERLAGEGREARECEEARASLRRLARRPSGQR